MSSHIRNIAIIAHVDHGKTTLVDKLLQQSGTLSARTKPEERMMDSNVLEKERGITITSKNTSITWKDYRINIVDTPGHADFGGEVERILSMVDSVLLLVDAVEGPMPQTRFVTQKAFAQNLNPIVVVNKIDRPGAAPYEAIDKVFDLFDSLGANESQLDFPVVYASALEGFAINDLDEPHETMAPLLDAIIEHAPPPQVDIDAPLQLQISSLDYSSFVGTIGIGRVKRGTIQPRQVVSVVDRNNKIRTGKILQVLGFQGLERKEIDSASAGDIIGITGLAELNISDTICDPKTPEILPALTVDEPTLSMVFRVNDSPLAGREGKFITSRKIEERLQKELLHNVALRVEPTTESDKFKVSGRGELHLGILIETMRREGYELAISKPEVVLKESGDTLLEPYENLTVDIDVTHQGRIMEKLGDRKGNLKDMLPDSKGRVRLDYIIPTRGLIGFYTEFMTATSGSGLIYHTFDHYGPYLGRNLHSRKNGVMISKNQGQSTGYALWKLQERGELFIKPQTEVYEGMIVGINARDADMVVNVTREKQLTNVRASGTDENIVLTPAKRLTLEQAMEFIEKDELVEVTPKSIRLRKKKLKEHERKRDTT